MALLEEVEQRGELWVAIGVPFAALVEDGHQRARVCDEVFGERLAIKQGRANPLETTAVLALVAVVDLPSAPAVVVLGLWTTSRPIGVLSFVVGGLISTEERHYRFGVFVDAGLVEERRILSSDGQRLARLNGVEIDKVAERVPLEGLNKSWATAFQTLEEVRPAEANQPLAGAAQVIDGIALLGCGHHA